jgi:hypothetical protein
MPTEADQAFQHGWRRPLLPFGRQCRKVAEISAKEGEKEVEKIYLYVNDYKYNPVRPEALRIVSKAPTGSAKPPARSAEGRSL